MPKGIMRRRNGFTIIEVVLVLAIGGLIFLMVFVALPNLQRGQRDTQRKNDLDRVSSSLISFVSNNNKLPDETISYNDATGIKIEKDFLTTDQNKNKVWAKFAYNYLLGGGSDVFEDPNGNDYRLYAVDIASISDNTGTLNVDNEKLHLASFDGAGIIVVAKGGSCGDSLETHAFKKDKSDGKRSFATAMFLENGGIYCVDN